MGNAPCKGNSFILPGVSKLLPLQGDRLPPQTTQGVALGYELLPLQGVLLIGVADHTYPSTSDFQRYPCPQHALKGQKLIAQGNALGCVGR